MSPLNMPNHVKKYDKSRYRGVVTKNIKKTDGEVCLVNVGLDVDIKLDKILPEGTRVTVEMEGNKQGKAISPQYPKVKSGTYWGYSVRIAESLNKVLTESPYKKGYDCLIGTSDKGESVDHFKMPKYLHSLIVFGGVHGINKCLEADKELKIKDPTLLFHHYLNCCPNQGSETIRTEEAVMITLAALRPKMEAVKNTKRTT